MATSESDADFESADEEIGRGASVKRNIRTTFRTVPSTVDSESDDDTECMQYTPCSSSDLQKRRSTSWTTVSSDMATSLKETIGDKDNNIDNDVKVESNVHINKSVDCVGNTSCVQENISLVESERSPLSTSEIVAVKYDDVNRAVAGSKTAKSDNDMSKVEAARSGKISKSSRQNPSRQLGAKKLGARIMKDDVNKSHVMDNVTTEQKDERLTECQNKEPSHFEEKDAECGLHEKSENQLIDDQSKSHSTDDLPETDMPEELKSNKKFKEVFQPEGWEGLGNDIELPDELTEEKLQPVLEKLSLASREAGSSLGSWSNWGNWGVTSLINTATAGVSTLTTHVSQGFTLLEETIGAPDPQEVAKPQQDEVATPGDIESTDTQEKESSSYGSFGFGNIISGVSSITKLVELTGSKVMTGGLDTLEAIGKKTMEVLQEGDPGLKKKRAFFMNEADKPILSQVLREAKEKAETEEKTIEERELARKVHFESLFDDYQGLVHLEALEMLSRQSNMKIQQRLIELDTNELTSMQETLEEIKELCDLSEEDKEDKDENLKNRLKAACDDLGIDITYEKLYNIWTETGDYLASSSTYTDQEIFQKAISTLARFTALSVERFHKTAELLLIKERRSTVNEADALVQVTNVLSDQISSLANSFCDTLNRFAETLEKPDDINANITTIFLEAANANSYIQDAFRLLIPILQVGAI